MKILTLGLGRLGYLLLAATEIVLPLYRWSALEISQITNADFYLGDILKKRGREREREREGEREGTMNILRFSNHNNNTKRNETK